MRAKGTSRAPSTGGDHRDLLAIMVGGFLQVAHHVLQDMAVRMVPLGVTDDLLLVAAAMLQVVATSSLLVWRDRGHGVQGRHHWTAPAPVMVLVETLVLVGLLLLVVWRRLGQGGIRRKLTGPVVQGHHIPGQEGLVGARVGLSGPPAEVHLMVPGLQGMGHLGL